MRIAYVVDVHDRFDAVPRALDAVTPVDVLLVGGDLTNTGRPDDVDRALELWRPVATRILAVAGNMDSPEIDERLVEAGVSLDGKGVMVGDVGFFGASAAPLSPLRTPYEVPDAQLSRRADAGLVDVAAALLLVFTPHAPPYGTACDRLGSGEHVGSPALRAFVVREQPHVVLCGHIHEARGEDVIHHSRIVNPGPIKDGHYALIEVDEATLREKWPFPDLSVSLD